MKVRIKVPTWGTFNRIPTGTPPQGLAALNAALGTSLSVGDPNPVWADLQDLDMGGAHLAYRGNTMSEIAEFLEIHNTAFLTFQWLGLAVAIGGDVEGYECFFKVADPSQLCPLRPVLDEEGDPLPQTWTDWGTRGAMNSGQEIDGHTYITNQDGNDQGKPLPASEYIGYATGADPNVSLVTVAEYKAIQPELIP